MKRLTAFFISLIILLGSSCISAYASQVKEITVSQRELLAGASEAIEGYLDEAKSNASDNLVYKIYIPSGNYLLTSALHIYSNTQLVLSENTVFSKGFSDGNMIKAGLKGETCSGYDGYKNIVISGGVWDVNYNGDSCAMRFAHCTNLTISNLTVKNIKNAHHIEVAAVDGLNVTGCTFSGYIRTTNSSAEALQIDVLHSYEHFPDYYNYDDTPCKNVTVSGCHFTDLYSGVGTRSGVVGSYFENIKIVDNTFENIREKAIYCFNYKNSEISRNTIVNSTCGISFEYYPSAGLVSEKLCMPNDTGKKNAVLSDCQSTISNNVINIKKIDETGESFGIFVHGASISKQQAESLGFSATDFTVKNIGIYSNEISCFSSESRGLFLTETNGSEIIGNILVGYAKADEGINAVNLCASKKNVIKSNTISGGFNNGISLYDKNGISSKSNSLCSNLITSVISYGVRVAGDSGITIKNTNNINSCGISSLCVSSKVVDMYLPDVTFKSSKPTQTGRASLRWNEVSQASGYKIYRSYGYGTAYKQIATIKGAKFLFEDKMSRPGRTYYYKVCPYKKVNSTVIIGGASYEYALSC
ncbi:MAG: hypothetical protein ACI4RR_01295 [Eubacterium sp.]